ncbi:MAG: hypothetical protein AB1762_12530 [Gemmatimonadota bacterium]
MMKRSVLFGAMGVLSTQPLSIEAQIRWSVDATPVVELGGTRHGDAGALGLPVGATRLTNGAIAVADQRLSSVRYFGADGKLVKATGTRGQGPGDFGLITWLGQCARDSVFVWDMSLRRMTVLDGSGGLARTYSVPAAASDGAPPFVVACSGSGAFAFQPSLRNPGTPPTPELPFVRGRSPVYVGNAAGTYVRRLTEVPEGELFVTGLTGGPRGGGPRPLGKTTSLAASGERIFIGTADSGFVDVYSANGERLTPLSLGVPLRRANQERYAAAIEELAKMAPAAMRDRLTTMLQGVPMPDHLPAYSALHSDSEGLLWVTLTVTGDTETHLRAYDATGTARGEVRLRGGVKVFEIGRDYILGGYDSSDGEPYVALFRLRR